MRRSIAILLFVFGAALPSPAHEYWMEAESFFLKPGERTSVRLFVGEGLKKEEERAYQTSKTNLFSLYSVDGIFDLRGNSRDEETPLLSFSSERAGTFLLALERNWSYITLESDKFAEYLKEDGLEYILDEREKLGETKKEGKERYSRYIKSLLLVGGRRDKTFSARTGMKLEIVPTENPYSKKAGESLSVQVLFQGKPLKNRTIFADNRDGEVISKQRMTTDAQGNAVVKLDRRGIWLVRLVHMQRCSENCEGADWESYWGALSFGLN